MSEEGGGEAQEVNSEAGKEQVRKQPRPESGRCTSASRPAPWRRSRKTSPCGSVRMRRLPLGERVSHFLSLRWGKGREGIRAAVRRATPSVGAVRVHGGATRPVESNSNASPMISKELRLGFPRVVLRPKALPANEIAHPARAKLVHDDRLNIPEVITGVAEGRSRGRRSARTKSVRSCNVLAKLTEVEGSLRDADRGRQVKFHGVAARHDRRDGEGPEVLGRKLVWCRQIEIAGAEPNQIPDAQGERATMAVDLSSLAQHGARERVRCAATRRDPGVQELKCWLIVGARQGAAIFERKPRVNPIHEEERRDSRRGMHGAVVRELDSCKMVVPVVVQAINAAANRVPNRSDGAFAGAVRLRVVSRAKLELGTAAAEERGPKTREPLAAPVGYDRVREAMLTNDRVEERVSEHRRGKRRVVIASEGNEMDLLGEVVNKDNEPDVTGRRARQRPSDVNAHLNPGLGRKRKRPCEAC